MRLDTDAGGYQRDMEVTSGHLSSNPPRVHFGLPAGARPRRLTVRWPDGSEDVVDTADGLAADTLLTVTR
ncbi:MAG: ASPIC/UnbV domain-containing protein [Spirochaetaceae bacterium]|nr:ASPIC/UnbV domain-containing protein [Spirochaetaceae bacterium]MDE0446581.1 ASPIC/UnbV domain-containing protein [Spirochaetaceae bacterium]